MNDSLLLAQVQPLSKQSPQRLEALAKALRDLDVQAIAGDVVECGVWHGATAIIAKIIAPHRLFWAIDTFDGMTLPDRDIDISHLGRSGFSSWHAKRELGGKWSYATKAEVAANLERFGIIDGVRYIKGDVCETLIDPAITLPDRIALLRLDTDWYKSTRVELDVLYPRLVRGGVLIIDDYGHWLGCRQATNEYFNLQPPNIWHWSAFTQIDPTAVMRVKEITPQNLPTKTYQPN